MGVKAFSFRSSFGAFVFSLYDFSIQQFRIPHIRANHNFQSDFLALSVLRRFETVARSYPPFERFWLEWRCLSLHAELEARSVCFASSTVMVQNCVVVRAAWIETNSKWRFLYSTNEKVWNQKGFTLRLCRCELLWSVLHFDLPFRFLVQLLVYSSTFASGGCIKDDFAKQTENSTSRKKLCCSWNTLCKRKLNKVINIKSKPQIISWIQKCCSIVNVFCFMKIVTCVQCISIHVNLIQNELWKEFLIYKVGRKVQSNSSSVQHHSICMMEIVTPHIHHQVCELFAPSILVNYME